ncbi:MAG: carboxypeptidase-like regulatory domain-containing protein [Flavobacteriaceae bacterium]|nr:carboxypeptidase-like regulatory domain-containing protein [Flavobacteriaceae bacterium]
MKLKYLIILFLSNYCLSQSYVIVDSITKEPIPYTNIKFINTNKGFYSNQKGKFKLDNKLNDSIQISCLGYDTVTSKVRNLKDSIFLKPKTEKLDEIIVYSSRPTLKKVGFKKGNFNFHTGSSLQFGLLIKPIEYYENTFINNILIPIKKSIIGEKKRDFLSILKVSLFSNKNDSPYESLLETPIIIKCNQDSENYINVDISEDYIKFDSNGIFLVIEIVGETNPEGGVINKKTSLPGIRFTDKKSRDFSISKLFYKEKFSNKWKEMKPEIFHLKKEIYLAIQLELAVYED